MALERVANVELRARDMSGATIGKFNTAMRRMGSVAKASFDKMSRAAKNFTSKMSGPSGAISSLAGMVGGVLALRSAAETIGAFELSMARVRAVTDATNDEFEKLTATARVLGATTEFTASQAAAGMEFLGRAGFEASEIIQAMPGILDLAASSTLELARAADITSNIMQAFQIDASESGRVADVLAKAAKSANTTVEQLGEAMKFVGPIAGSLKIPVEDAAAAIAVMGNAGLQSSLAGTGFRRILSSLINPTDEAREALERLGLIQADVNPETVKLTDIFQKFKDANIDAAEALQIFGLRGGPAILAVTGQADKVKELTAALEGAGGTVKVMAALMRDTLPGAVKQFKSAMEELLLIIGEAGFLATATSLTQTMVGLTRSIGETAQALPEMTAAFTTFAALFVGGGTLLAGLGLFVGALGLLGVGGAVALAVIAGIAAIAAAFVFLSKSADNQTIVMAALVRTVLQVALAFEKVALVLSVVTGEGDRIRANIEALEASMMDLDRSVELASDAAAQAAFDLAQLDKVATTAASGGLLDMQNTLMDVTTTTEEASDAFQEMVDEFIGGLEKLEAVSAAAAKAPFTPEQLGIPELPAITPGIVTAGFVPAFDIEAFAAETAVRQAAQQVRDDILIEDSRVRLLEAQGQDDIAEQLAFELRNERRLKMLADQGTQEVALNAVKNAQIAEQEELSTRQFTRMQQEQLRQARIAAAGIGAFSTSMTALLGKNNAIALVANKASATANTILNTAEGIMKASTLAFPLNIAIMGLIGAAGAAQLAVIAGVSLGGGGGGAAPPGGGGGFGPGFERGGPIVPFETREEDVRPQVIVNIEGNNVDQTEFGRVMVETLRDIEVEEI